MKRTIVPLAAAFILLSGASVSAQGQVEGAPQSPGTIPTTTTAPPSGSTESQGDPRIAPPVNPLPSYYAINKPRPPGVGDDGIAPPINPLPAPTVDPSAFNTAPRSGGN